MSILLFALSACATAPPPPEFLPARPPESGANGNGSSEDVVAFYNGDPVRWNEVAKKVLEFNLRGAIGNYVRWRVVQDRMAELGIENPPEQLRKRAETVVHMTRKKMGEKAFGAQLKREGLSEGQYLDFVAASKPLQFTFSVEKIVRYEALTAGSVTLQRFWFSDQKDAEAFAIQSREKGVSAALAALEARAAGARARFGRLAPETYVPGGSPLNPPIDPWTTEKLLKASKGDLVGPERSRTNLFFVLQVEGRQKGREAAYAEVKDEILTGILASPPPERICEHWLSTATGKVKVEMADRPAAGKGKD